MDILQKKALYLACHRGTKEADLLIGSFVREYLLAVEAPLETDQRLCEWLNQEDNMILNPHGESERYSPFPSLFKQWLEKK